MRLEYGSEDRFFDFIKNIDKKDKVALVSHIDLDGLAAAVVANKVLDADFLHFVNYDDLNNNLVQSLKEQGANKVIVTDLFIKFPEFVEGLEKFADVLIIDHHLSKRDWNSNKTTFINCEQGYCAGYMCYYLFGGAQDLTAWDWLVACSCVSDYCVKKPESWLKGVFEKYDDRLGIDEHGNVRRDGAIWDLQWDLCLALIQNRGESREAFEEIGERFGEIGKLKDHAAEVQKEFDHSLGRFDSEKEEIEGGYYWMFRPRFPIGSFLVNWISSNDTSKTFVFVRGPHDGRYFVSARRQDEMVNMDEFLSGLLEGFDDSSAGGHVPAAGGYFLKKDLQEYRRRLGLKEEGNT